MTPRFNTRKNNGARVENWNDATAFYSSAHGNAPFEREDAAGDTPKQLAGKFIVRFSAIVMLSHGEDKPYAEWYSRMILATEPDGLISALEDFLMWVAALGEKANVAAVSHQIECTIRALGVTADIPLPPPGEAISEVVPDCYRE